MPAVCEPARAQAGQAGEPVSKKRLTNVSRFNSFSGDPERIRTADLCLDRAVC